MTGYPELFFANMGTIWQRVIVAVYLAAVLGMGARARRRARGNADEFYLAGRRMGAWPIGLSVMITLFNAVNFAAFPTEIIGHGLYVWVSVPVFFLAAWPVAQGFIPWFRRQPGLSGYAWLEARYGLGVRRVAAALFLLWRVAWMAVALYATGRMAAPLLGWPAPAIMAAATVLALVYTSMGGLRAVLWTDVLQFSILCGSLVLAVAWTVGRLPDGWGGLMSRAMQEGAFAPFAPADPAFWLPDPTVRITLWSGLIGTGVAFVARYAADQMILQRYHAARSVRAAQRGIWINAAAAVFVLSLLTLLGLAAVASGAGSADLSPPARLAALFLSLPGPIAGLVAAALLATTMSSMDSGLHACAATLFSDFHHRGAPADGPIRHPRLPMALLAGLAFLLALPMGRLGGLFSVVNRVINGLGSPLLGLVLAGMVGRGFTARGLAWGAGLGFVASVVISVGVEDLSLHLYAVVNLLLTLLLCVACSAADRFARRLWAGGFHA